LSSDAAAGDDGILQANEVVQLNINADLVVLSACDTAVGRLQGQEGIANLSHAFLLAGAKTVSLLKIHRSYSAVRSILSLRGQYDIFKP